MVLVDTSVLIDYLKGADNAAVKKVSVCPGQWHSFWDQFLYLSGTSPRGKDRKRLSKTKAIS